MEKKIIFTMSVMMLLLAGIALAAKHDFIEAQAGRATAGIPEHAVEVAPGVFSLGSAMHNGKLVEGYAFVDYKKGFGKPTGCNHDGVCQRWEDASCDDCAGGGDDDSSSCYGFLGRGVKWKTAESYIVNPANTRGLDESFVVSSLAANIQKWEDAAGVDILGEGTSTSKILIADTSSPDDKNEVYFADIGSNGAIGVTIVWGVFRGPPQSRELVEWDQIYDDVDFDWSASGEHGKMDFENIATHELGHSVGMDDLYEEKCSEQTMYGYASFGETKKRTLESGDIKGIQELY